jgi:hypothetical protein
VTTPKNIGSPLNLTKQSTPSIPSSSETVTHNQAAPVCEKNSVAVCK